MKKLIFVCFLVATATTSFAQTSNSADSSKLRELFGAIKQLTIEKDSCTLEFGSAASLLIDGEKSDGLKPAKKLLTASLCSGQMILEGKLIKGNFTLYLSEKPTKNAGKLLKVNFASQKTWLLFVGIETNGFGSGMLIKKNPDSELKIVL